MSGKLKDYQVLDVLCGGTFYKVRHKVTNDIFAWRAFDCSALSDEQIQNVVKEIRLIGKMRAANLLRYYDTILHPPSRTLYFVVEFNRRQSLSQLLEVCAATDKYIAESFAWHLLLEAARVCKAADALSVIAVTKCISADGIFVGDSCDLVVDCFRPPAHDNHAPPLMRQLGDVMSDLCYSHHRNDNIQEYYSDDLRDIVSFLTEERAEPLKPDVVLYHPTVLTNIDAHTAPKHISEVLVSAHASTLISEANKCDSEKAGELCQSVEPVPRVRLSIMDSPIYCNLSPKRKEIEQCSSARASLSPTIAALALELPGFVPRSRKPINQVVEAYKPKLVSEETLSQQWMSRLVALRQREESLNKRERELIAKEIVNSPAAKVVPLNDSLEVTYGVVSNGITLPPEIGQGERGAAAGAAVRASRRRRRASCGAGGGARTRTVRATRYEDLDSSLSADPGDASFVITATKFTKDNMPRRNIFPDLSSKRVHFTSANPFVESDESVTLTFYELESVDAAGYQVPRKEDKVIKDINKFKYLDLEKVTSDKRATMQQGEQASQASPSKQAKICGKKVFGDITNTSEGMRKTPSKMSLSSKGSTCDSQILTGGTNITSSSSSGVGMWTRSSTARLSMAHSSPPHTEKKSKRKSLIPFKTPFKFMTATKI